MPRWVDSWKITIAVAVADAVIVVDFHHRYVFDIMNSRLLLYFVLPNFFLDFIKTFYTINESQKGEV